MSVQVSEPDDKPAPRPGSAFSRIAVWFILFAMIVLLVALILVSSSIKDLKKTLDGQLVQVNRQLAITATPIPQEQALNAALNDARRRLNTLTSLRDSLKAEAVNWPSVVSAIARYDSASLSLTALTLTERRITLNGYAASEANVVDYVQSMRSSGRFSQVIVQSVSVQAGKVRPAWLPRNLVAEFSIVAELRLEPQ